MTTESELYNDLKAAIEAIPEIKEVRLYNSDVAEITQGRQNIFQFPAVFVEFEYGDHGTDYGRRQQIDLTVRLYVCAFNLKVPDTYLFELKNKVHRIAQGLGAEKDSYVPLNRIMQRQDVDHGNMPLWSMDYETAYIDNVEEEYQEVQLQPKVVRV
jgi:hypothetical protein